MLLCSRGILLRGSSLILLVSCGGFGRARNPPEFVITSPSGAGARVQIVHGRPTNLRDFGASLKYVGNAQNCTATMIGPRTVLIAAHCVKDKAVGIVRVGGHTIGATCHRPSVYAAGHHDLALCGTASDVTLPHDAAYERINLSSAVPALQDTVLLQGFGCQGVGGTGRTGVLAEGEAAVDSLDAANGEIRTVGGVAVCSGDSGGAVYLRIGARRMVVAVNARGDLKLKSTLTSTAGANLRSFIDGWTEKICGRDGDARNCHG